MKTKTCTVPVYSHSKAIKLLEKEFDLSEDEKESITNIVKFHGCEFSSIVERVAIELDVEYPVIRNLLERL